MERYNESLKDISFIFTGWLYLGMIQREVSERADDGMYDRNSVREREGHKRHNRPRKKERMGKSS